MSDTGIYATWTSSFPESEKGTRGITELLSLEAVHAFEDRKARAKRKGEETGTKLLVPMIMMLAVVLVIVIVPAFWSMGI